MRARPTPPLAYPCPACGARETDLRKAERDDAYLVRHRHCRDCGLDFETYEIPAAALARLMDRAGPQWKRNAA